MVKLVTIGRGPFVVSEAGVLACQARRTHAGHLANRVESGKGFFNSGDEGMLPMAVQRVNR